MTADTRRKIIGITTIFLIVASFGGSYTHGVQWAQEHLMADQPGGIWWARFIALIPELTLAVAALRLMDNPKDKRVWTIGVLAFAWNVWTNGASAAGGVSGMVVALLPAVSALLMLWINGHPLPAPEPQPQPELVAKRSATRVTIEHASQTAQAQPRPTVTATVRPPVQRAITASGEGQLAAGVAYVKGLPGYGTPGFVIPTRPVIQEATGISNSTAKRAVAAIRMELDR